MHIQVYSFVKGPNGEVMDDMSFTLPVMKENGDQVHVTTKVLKALP